MEDEYRHIPNELKEWAQWVAWRAVPKPDSDKVDKLPVDPKNGSLGSHSDPSTWGSFEQAVNQVQSDSSLAGIGFVFSENDPYCGIDIDSCIIDSQIKPSALAIIEKLNSYSEISPSLKGVKVWCRGRLPGRGKNIPGKLEMYDKVRFFTVTGLKLDGVPSTIEARQNEVNEIYHQFFGSSAESASRNSGQAADKDQINRLLDKCYLLGFCKAKADKGHSLGHNTRIGLGSYSIALADLQNDGMPFITSMLRNCPDFNPKITRRQLESIKDGSPWGCEAIRRQVSSEFADFDPGKCSCKLTVKGRKPCPLHHIFPDLAGTGQDPDKDDEEEARWTFASTLFKRLPFPWQVLPPPLEKSLKTLARACATSDSHLPGTCFAIVSSLIGRSLEVSPKRRWVEPLIFWTGDIRETGDGKTPPGSMLTEKIKEFQRWEHERYDGEMQRWKLIPKKERDGAQEPIKPRGYYSSSLTLEGLREDLAGHPTGGLLVIQEELSGFVSSQNQYKSGKGSDRESWLELWDGNPSRILRVGRAIHVAGARVNLFGGIQPAVFARCFGSENGLYLSDGTVFRFLFTHEPTSHFDLTDEEWTDEDRDAWQKIITGAENWVNGQIDQAGEEGIKTGNVLLFDDQARKFFITWRNKLNRQKRELPKHFAGFLPKAYSYAARIAGILHCIDRFHQGLDPKNLITAEEVQRGIKVIEFYLGQAADAMQLLKNSDYIPADTSEQMRYLSQTLQTLRPQLDSGRLAVSFIHEEFNKIVPEELRIKTSKAMGAFLRGIPLSVSTEKHDANGRRAVYCLEWDEKINSFLKTMSAKSAMSENGTGLRFAEADIENQSLHPKNGSGPIQTDIADIADVVSTESKKSTAGTGRVGRWII